MAYEEPNTPSPTPGPARMPRAICRRPVPPVAEVGDLDPCAVTVRPRPMFPVMVVPRIAVATR